MSVATNKAPSVSPVGGGGLDTAIDPGMPLWKRELILRKRTMNRTFPLSGLFSSAVLANKTAAALAVNGVGEEAATDFPQHHQRTTPPPPPPPPVEGVSPSAAVYLSRDHAPKVHGWRSTNNESDGRARSQRSYESEHSEQPDVVEVAAAAVSAPHYTNGGSESALATQASPSSTTFQRRIPAASPSGNRSPNPTALQHSAETLFASPLGSGKMGEDKGSTDGAVRSNTENNNGHHPDLATRGQLVLLNLCQPPLSGTTNGADPYSDDELDLNDGYNHSARDTTYQYGPGIVNRLKSKFISLGLRDSPLLAYPGGPVRRVASLEQLLDMDDHPLSSPVSPPTVSSPTNWSSPTTQHRPAVVLRLDKRYTPRSQRGGNELLKRARSMETLSAPERSSGFGSRGSGFYQRGYSRDDSVTPFMSPVNDNVIIIEHSKSNGDASAVTSGGMVATKPATPLSALSFAPSRKSSTSVLDDDEFPKPDTVRTYLRLFESPSEDDKRAASPASPQPPPSTATVTTKPVAVSTRLRRVTPPSYSVITQPAAPTAKPASGPFIRPPLGEKPALPTSPKPKPGFSKLRPTSTSPPDAKNHFSSVASDYINELHKAETTSNNIVNGGSAKSSNSVLPKSPSGGGLYTMKPKPFVPAEVVVQPVEKEVVVVVQLAEKEPVALVNGFHHNGHLVEPPAPAKKDTVDHPKIDGLVTVTASTLPVYPPVVPSNVSASTPSDAVIGSSSVQALAENFKLATAAVEQRPSIVTTTTATTTFQTSPFSMTSSPSDGSNEPKVVSSQLKKTKIENKPTNTVVVKPKVVVVEEAEQMVNGSSSTPPPAAATGNRNAVGVSQLNGPDSKWKSSPQQPPKVNGTTLESPQGVSSPSLQKNRNLNSPPSTIYNFTNNTNSKKSDYLPGGGGGGVSGEDSEDHPMNSTVIEFFNDNVKLVRSSLLKTKNKKLKLAFNDTALSTFEYPSEGSFSEDDTNSIGYSENSSLHSPSSPSPYGSIDNSLMDQSDTNGGINNSTTGGFRKAMSVIDGSPAGSTLKSTPGLGSIGGLASYTPMVVNNSQTFELGVTRAAPSTPQQSQRDVTTLKDSSSEEDLFLKPATDDQNIVWSNAETSDILF